MAFNPFRTVKELADTSLRVGEEVNCTTCYMCAFPPPALLIMTTLAFQCVAGALLAVAAGVGLTAGGLTERWLFFAEARHVGTLFYRQTAT